MNTIKKLSIGVLIAVVGLSLSGIVSAAETTAELKVKISALQGTHTELKAKVQAGTLSIEEAQSQWKELITQARAEKEEFFKARMEKIQSKYQEFAEKNPERAALVKERIDASVERRAEITAKQLEVKAKVEAGVMTRSEALKIKKEVLEAQHVKMQEVRASIKAKQEARVHIQADGVKGEARVNGFIKIDDVKGETRTNSAVSGSRPASDARGVGFDPMGLNALEAFPGIKSDINAATNARARIEGGLLPGQAREKTPRTNTATGIE